MNDSLPDSSLSELRKKIDALDDELILILQKRFAVVKEIGAYKAVKGLPQEDLEREAKVIEDKTLRLQQLGIDDPVFAREFFTFIFKKSKQIQIHKKKIPPLPKFTIALVGGKGKMGSLFAEKFIEQGHSVIIIDKCDNCSELIPKANIVIITVPIKETEKVIREIAPYIHKDALLTDFTSLKENPCAVMQNSFSNEIIGGHPLFGPLKNIKKQNFILCPVRGEKYLKKYQLLLESLGLNVSILTPKEHDELMAVVQGLTHLSHLALLSSLQKLQANLSSLEKISSPVYRLRLQLAERMLAQDSELYADIQLRNPAVLPVVEKYQEALQELIACTRDKDRNKFINIFQKMQDYFGEQSAISMKITDKIIEEFSHE